MDTTEVLAVGDRFLKDESKAYTEGGIKAAHNYTVLCEVTATHSAGFDYKVVEVTAEQGRPSFGTPHKAGSIAWFAVPVYVARGTLRIV